MKLVIVESPNKTKTISQYLGKDYLVLASAGHVRDLATKGDRGFGVDVEHGFKPTYVIYKNKYDIVRKLRNAAKEAEDVYIATDPDREGEAIAWHLAEVLNLDPSKAKRLSFNAITKTQVLKAIANPSHIDMDLVASQETRRILDRIIGFDLSKLVQHKIKTNSAGRVQSVTLKMIVERQKEIDEFVPVEYYDISGIFGQEKIEASLYSYKDEIFKPYSINKEKYEEIVNALPKKFKVLEVVKSQRSSSPRPPFITSTLQQEAFTQFKYSSKSVSHIAQSLFEGVEVSNGQFQALITYIRTDSTRLADEFIDIAGPYIVSHFGKGTYKGPVNKAKKNSELVQDAHEAIRPVDLSITPEKAKAYLSKEQYNIYRLIYARSLASLMAPKIEEVSTLKFDGNGYIFKAEAVKTISKGYLAAYEECGFKNNSKDTSLPESLTSSEIKEIEAIEIKGDKKETQPPHHFNDGSLIKQMEEKGIGRPSTYSSTIDTLNKEYIKEVKHVITPTEEGKLAVESLNEYFPDLMDYNYTKEMEDKLEQVKSGDTSKNDLLSEFYAKFSKDLEFAEENMAKVNAVEVGENCPECGHPLVYRKSKNGTFIGCSNFPSCRYKRSIDGKEKQPDEIVEGRTCPLCGKPLVYKTSKKGTRFIGCSSFPKCRYTESIEGDKKEELDDPLKLNGTSCPTCKEGHLVFRKSRYGYIYGCSNYPRCHYMLKLNKNKELVKKDED